MQSCKTSKMYASQYNKHWNKNVLEKMNNSMTIRDLHEILKLNECFDKNQQKF